MKATIILGNITFNEGSAEIHEIRDIIYNVPKDSAMSVGEELVNLYEGYIIPELYEGTITLTQWRDK